MTLTWLPPLSLREGAVLLATLVLAVVALRWALGGAAALARRWELPALRLACLTVLLVILFNPVEERTTPGSKTPADVFLLFDASRSMALEEGDSTRWQRGQAVAAEAFELIDQELVRPQAFRFGDRLSAINPADRPADENSDHASSTLKLGEPTEDATQICAALRQAAAQFGRHRPASVVLFSDGRTQDSAELDGAVQAIQVPVHVLPLGNANAAGDVAIVAVVVPDRVRNGSQVGAQVALRSFGLDGRRVEVRVELATAGAPPKQLDALPLTLTGGEQSIALSFRCDLDTRKLRFSVSALEGELSAANNVVERELRVDRTKVRVLYLEGSRQPVYAESREGIVQRRGAYSALHSALAADPDLECAVLSAADGSLQPALGQIVAFPRTLAELAAFDAILISDVPRSALTDEQVSWIQHAVGERGAGLCMVGGADSFAGGGWQGEFEALLPVELAGSAWQPSQQVKIVADEVGRGHPLLRLSGEREQDRRILESLPPFQGLHLGLRPKPGLATLVASASTPDAAPVAALVAGTYGRGRTLAFACAITEPAASGFANWGAGDGERYRRFWQGAIYWLTENSVVGRRRLLAEVDKHFYRPGEEITLSATAFDERANPNVEYRVVAMVEPESFDVGGDDAPLRWPKGVERAGGEAGPLVAWGEEFELPLVKGDQPALRRAVLPLTSASGAASQTLRLEVTAYSGEIQVDSTSLALQVIDDPVELRNPTPDHRFLKELAAGSGGQVLASAQDLAALLRDLPVASGPPQVRRSPLWSNAWLYALLLGLLGVEWSWRQRLGLA